MNCPTEKLAYLVQPWSGDLGSWGQVDALGQDLVGTCWSKLWFCERILNTTAVPLSQKNMWSRKLLNPSPSQGLLMDFIKFIVFLLTVELLNLTNKASENDDHSFQTWFVQITSNSYVQLARHAERRVQTHCISTCLASTRSTRQALTSSLLLGSEGFHPRHPALQISWSWTWSIKACWVDDACKHLLHQWKLALCVSESTSTVHQLTCTLKWPALFTHNHCLLILGIFWNHCRDLHWRYFSQSTTALVCSCYVYMRPSKRQK